MKLIFYFRLQDPVPQNDPDYAPICLPAGDYFPDLHKNATVVGMGWRWEPERECNTVSGGPSEFSPCKFPFIDYNGDVLMCSHDWGKKNILGNLNKKSFIEIWTSQVSNMSRKSLINGNRNFSPCDVCDVEGTLIGNEHSEAWGKIN